MIGLVLGWCVAWAAPQTVELANGVRVVVDTTPALGERVHVGWFSDIGSATTSPGAVSTALAAHRHGTQTVAEDDVTRLWNEALGTEPTLHVCAHDAGSVAQIDAVDLEAWAWLTSDALADTVLNDLSPVHRTAVHHFPLQPMDGIDRAPAPESWPRVLPSHPVDDATVRTTLSALASAGQLIVVVRGDVDVQTVQSTLAPYFERLPNTRDAAASASPAPRTVTREQVQPGAPLVLIRHDLPADTASRDLARTLDAHAGTALADVAFDARVELITDAPVWTLELYAQPAPGQSERVAPAWTAWLQSLQGAGLPDAPPSAPPSVTRIAHDVLATAPSQRSREEVLATVVGSPYTLVRSRPVPDDEDLDTIRRTVGELAAELVRIRLRELDTVPTDQLPSWIDAARADRDAVAPRLRPALDLLIERAEERMP